MRLFMNLSYFASSKVWNKANYDKEEEKIDPIRDLDFKTPLQIRVRRSTKYMGSSQPIQVIDVWCFLMFKDDYFDVKYIKIWK